MDGYFLPESVYAIFASGKQNDVPLLAGWNHDEGSFEIAFSPQKPTADSLKATALKEFGDKAAEFLRLYPSDTPEQTLRSAERFCGLHRFIAFSTWDWMESQAKTGKQPIYRFRFDLVSAGAILGRGRSWERFTRRRSSMCLDSSIPKRGSRGERRIASSANRCRNTGRTLRGAGIRMGRDCRSGRCIRLLRDGR